MQILTIFAIKQIEMILRIVIENFRSIKDRAEFSMEPTALKDHSENVFTIGKNKALNAAVIYGPNASGKSNIILAFRAIEHLVSESADFKPNRDLDPYEPFKLDKSTQNAPVSFEVEFIASNKIKYLFIISFSQKEFVKEEAYTFQKNQKALIYSRSSEGIEYGDYYKGNKKSIANKLLPNQLFISKAVVDKNEILEPIFDFFDVKLYALSWVHDFQKHKYQQLFAGRLAEDSNKNFNIRFNKLISAFDTGILEVKSQKEDWTTVQFPESVPEEIKKKLKEDYLYNIRTVHKIFDNGVEAGTILFDKDDESLGTRNLFSIAGIILDALEMGSILVVDEFDNNLHPHITKALINLFLNPKINKRKAQLIFATHDLSQLDNEVFRRDQIWFTEKDKYGGTSIFSLSDIKGVRNTIPYDKWYSSGRFGAIPIINELELYFDEEEQYS
jgi:AAA15 family ATPase/GTPase